MTELCPCSFDSQDEERKVLSSFLREYGDNLPEDVIERSVSNTILPNWSSRCDCTNPKKIISVAHYEVNDWYLCTVKGMAVRMEERGKGYGRKIAQQVVDHASLNPKCVVLAADVTSDNESSLKALRRAGFQQVSHFCWEKGAKPADILHLVRFHPVDGSCPG